MRLKIFSALLFMAISFNAQTRSINIDASKKYQTIDNFAASDCWWAHKIGALWSKANKDSIAELLFSTEKGIGLSGWRFNLGAGIDPAITDPWRTVTTFEVSRDVYDWTRNEGGQWFLKAAKERGVEQFVAFVNSPPRRMTRNGHSFCNDVGSTNLKDGYYNQFAKYLVDILKHFRDSLDININYISPVNEPQWEWTGSSQEGNRASNEDIKKIVDSLYAELQNQNVSTKIIIPESGSLPDWYNTVSSISSKYGEIYGNYLYGLFNDSVVASKVTNIFSGHSYWSDLLDSELVQAREALYDRMSRFFSRGFKYWVSEYCILEGTNGQGGNGRDLSIKTALDIARIIHYDLTITNASAWQWWLAVSKYDYKDGLIYTDYGVKGTAQSIIQSKTLWALGNYSRFIRPGSKRIECSGADDKNGLMASSYINSSNSQIITVLVNVSYGEQDVKLNFTGLDSSQTIGFLNPYITSNDKDDNLKPYRAFSVDSTFTVPARSVVTITAMLDGSAITKVETTDDVPQKFLLSQNYPNPFNPVTTIKYTIPNVETTRRVVSTTLHVYDVLGGEVATLVNEPKAPGVYEVHFDGSRFSSGVYFYKLTCGEFSQTRKALLLK